MIFVFFRKELRGGAFLVQLLEERCFLQVLSGGIVSGWVCTSAKVVFLFLPFSLERKRKKQGEPTNGSPLTPFQRSTGTLSPSIAPAQGDRVCVSHQAEVEKYRAGDVPPPRWGCVGGC